MKTDLEHLMKDQGIDALLITGPASSNPAMVYFTGLVHVTMADLVVKAGSEPVLFYPPMERDEAAKTGLPSRSYTDYPMKEFLSQAGNDVVKARAMRYQKMLKDCGVETGTIAIYGNADAGSSYAIFSALQKIMPEVEITGFPVDELLMQAMMTKDESELTAIAEMGKVTIEVVDRTANFLTKQQVRNETLVQQDGSPLKIKDVKSRIDLWLAELGAANPEATIFAIGRDAGVPHSTGNPEDVLVLGKTIVYDIFPCQAGGGFFYDFTRTWCLGYAPDDAVKLYEDVKYAYDALVGELKVDQPFTHYQKRTCEIFERQGHATIAQDPSVEEGYVHSIGHGVGLHIHEKPFSGANTTPTDRLAPGSVFTIEPGLYYPSRGMGVRIEDTYCVGHDGSIKTLADYPAELVLKMKK